MFMYLSRVGSGSIVSLGVAALLGVALALAPASPARPASATSGSGSDPALTGSLGSLVLGTGSASAGAHEAPPYIEAADWADRGGRPVLEVVPTAAGRTSWGVDDEAAAWAEVVALAPDAATAGMREQFACHWVFARVVEPDKATWNLEPWRPVVSDIEMIASGCNPTSAGSSGSALS